MDEARAVINLKEGAIELQGPVDFVKHYLDMYQGAIDELRGLREDVTGTPERAGAAARRGRQLPAKRQRGACIGAIRGYYETGFFDEPRSVGEVKRHLSETGVRCTDSATRTSLRRLTSTGQLQTAGQGRALRYRRAAAAAG
ncbi:MAG: hypothetical protein HYX96_09035 [Chloroflexi bacterium]|nr:hypothetical protein [Chloroflexota bacterium]